MSIATLKHMEACRSYIAIDHQVPGVEFVFNRRLSPPSRGTLFDAEARVAADDDILGRIKITALTEVYKSQLKK